MSKRAVRPLQQLARASFGLLAFVLALLLVTTVYEAVATANERARFQAPGRLVDVDGIGCISAAMVKAARQLYSKAAAG